MPPKILMMCAKFRISQQEYEEIASHLAGAVSDVHGLRWKIWLVDAAQNEAGGIYLFDDEQAIQAFLSGPVLAGLKNHLALISFCIRQFDVLEAATLVTHGPIRHGVPV